MKTGTIAIVVLGVIAGYLLWEKYNHKKKCNCSGTDTTPASSPAGVTLPGKSSFGMKPSIVKDAVTVGDTVLNGAVVEQPQVMVNPQGSSLAFSGYWNP